MAAKENHIEIDIDEAKAYMKGDVHDGRITLDGDDYSLSVTDVGTPSPSGLDGGSIVELDMGTPSGDVIYKDTWVSPPKTQTDWEMVSAVLDDFGHQKTDRWNNTDRKEPLKLETRLTGRLWQQGTVEPGSCDYQAKVESARSEHGIDGGNVSELEVLDCYGRTVAQFDRQVWNIKPEPGSFFADVVDAIVGHYRDHMHQLPAGKEQEAAASPQDERPVFEKRAQLAQVEVTLPDNNPMRFFGGQPWSPEEREARVAEIKAAREAKEAAEKSLDDPGREI